MEEKNCINAGRPVYFSYARNSSRNPEWEHISDCMDKLLEVFEEKNIEYRLDKRDIGTGDKISKFEEEIGWKSEVVVIIFSDKYFRSMHCMYEFVQIKRALEKYPEKRIMCIKSGDFNLSDVNYIRELERYWGNQEQDYKEIEYHRLRAHSGTEKAAWQNGFYLNDIRNLYSFFSSTNYSVAQLIDYNVFTDDIIKYYKKHRKPKFTPKEKIEENPKGKTKVEPKPDRKTPPSQPAQTVRINTPQMPPIYCQIQMPSGYYQTQQMPYAFADDYKPQRSVFSLTRQFIGILLLIACLVAAVCLDFLLFDDMVKSNGRQLDVIMLGVSALTTIFIVRRIIKLRKVLIREKKLRLVWLIAWLVTFGLFTYYITLTSAYNTLIIPSAIIIIYLVIKMIIVMLKRGNYDY